MPDHTKLKAFQLADQLVLMVYESTKQLPAHEQFGLTSQMRRCAVSIASNIVEGSARRTTADYVRFLEIAYGSARELSYQASIAHRLGYLSQPQYEPLDKQAVETSKCLNGLIRSLG